MSQGVSGDPKRHKHKSQLKINIFNANTFIRTSSCLEVLEYQTKG